MNIQSKSELLELTHQERMCLEEKIKQLSYAELVFPASMGDWSVKDILQHLVDWEQRWIRWYEAGKQGEQVHTPEVGYNWRQLDRLNEAYRQKHIQRSLDDVMIDFYASYQQILSLIEQIPEEEMLARGIYPWTGKLPLIQWIAGNTCEHYKWACQMIRPVRIRRVMKAENQS